MVWRIGGLIGGIKLGGPKVQKCPPAGQGRCAINGGAAGAYCTSGLVYTLIDKNFTLFHKMNFNCSTILPDKLDPLFSEQIAEVMPQCN